MKLITIQAYILSKVVNSHRLIEKDILSVRSNWPAQEGYCGAETGPAYFFLNCFLYFYFFLKRAA